MDNIIAIMTIAAHVDFMRAHVGQTVQVLVEENNVARDPHDIPVKICGAPINPRTICNVHLTGITNDMYVGCAKNST